MQELTLLEHHHHQQQQFVAINPIPPSNCLTSLTPSSTPSPTGNSPSNCINNSWINFSSTATSPGIQESAYQPHYSYSDSSSYYPNANINTPFPNSMQSPLNAQHYYQSSESDQSMISNQCEDETTESMNQESSTSGDAKAVGARKKKSGKSTYKHVPHREKPVHLVARRNARERRRVQAVNSAFAKLRKVVPVENRNKRLSKVKTLQRAIEYIHALQDVLEDADEVDGIVNQEEIIGHDHHEHAVNGNAISMVDNEDVGGNKYNKENQMNDQRWVGMENDSMNNHHYSDVQYTPGYNCNYRYLKCLP